MTLLLYDIIKDDKQSVDTGVEKRNQIFYYFLRVALYIKKMNKNKYIPLFFTDRLVYTVFEAEEWFNKFVKEESNKLDEATVNEFINTLLIGECNSVTEIKDYKRRPLSEFTDKKRDKDKTCCEEEPNYHVFNSYLKKQGKEITQSAFSQQKDKYFHIKEKIGLV